MDLAKLTPAPWYVQIEGGGVVMAADDCPVAECGGDVDAEFIALARNAFAVMMDRNWTPVPIGNGYWMPQHPDDGTPGYFTNAHPGRVFTDPFTAIVEADKFYRANIDKRD